MDWYDWHDDYERPESRLSARLAAVQRQIRGFLDAAPTGPIRAVSACAGQGRDLIGVLATHPRRDDVTARLVELDQRNVDVARDAARAAGLTQVDVAAADAAMVDSYAGAVPADLVLLCGIFGNITDADVRRTVAHTDQLSRAGATVIWTRHRKAPDLVPVICDWFAEHDFQLVWLSDPAAGYGVAAHRFAGTTRAPVTGTRLFTFTPDRSAPEVGG
jgi:hypothetical protein